MKDSVVYCSKLHDILALHSYSINISVSNRNVEITIASSKYVLAYIHITPYSLFLCRNIFNDSHLVETKSFQRNGGCINFQLLSPQVVHFQKWSEYLKIKGN